MTADMLSDKLCECGCGEFTYIATRSDSRRSQVKGQPMRYLPAHSSATAAMRNFGAATRPILDVADREITEADILNLRDVDELQAADIFDARVRRLEARHRATFVEMGLILMEMEDRELYRVLVDPATGHYWTSYDRWLCNAAPISRSGGYAAVKAMRNTVIPISDLREMPRFAVETISQLSPAVQRNPVVIISAKNDTEEVFREKLEKNFPDQHIETKKSVRLKTDKSSRVVFDKAVEAMMVLYEAATREEAIGFLCTRFLSETCEVEEYAMLTNELALEEVKLSRKRAS